MRAKKLGRHDLLAWVNNLVQSDYTKIENLSDGVGLCQIFDAFFETLSPEMMKLKLNSKSIEDWEKNFAVLNEILTKVKSYKQVDPIKMSKGKFTTNFEFLQFTYDYIAKTFNIDVTKKYSAYERRVEIAKAQYGNKISDIKKYIAGHLIPNEVILKLDKQKYFTDFENREEAAQEAVKEEREKQSQNDVVSPILDKYKDFFRILQEDLRKLMDRNLQLSEEIKETEEERQYYLEKIKSVLVFCEKKLQGKKMKPETAVILDNIIKLIIHVPEDFK